MAADRAQRLVSILRRRGPSRAADLLRELDVSQPVFSRLVKEAGADVVTIGRARATRYAARRPLVTIDRPIPIHRIDAGAHPESIGVLHAIAPAGFWHAYNERTPAYIREPAEDGLSEGLPYYVADMRPQGFLGRAIARAQQGFMSLPLNPESWSDDDILTYLALRGADCPGALVVGEASLEVFYRTVIAGPMVIPAARVAGDYPALAEKVLAGSAPGSSAGGEQPKFTATVDAGNGPRAVIVKFSPAVENAVHRRWADLLVTEHLALEVLREAGYLASRSRLIEAGNRVFLEVERFDRMGVFGRRDVVSLAALDDALYGSRDTWTLAAERLARDRRITLEDRARMEMLDLFAAFIANSDRHFGNLSFLPGDAALFALAPVYDMLPMAYAPVGTEIVVREFLPPTPPAGGSGQWADAARLAVAFWDSASGGSRISEEFRTLCRGNATAIRHTVDRVLAGG